MEEGQLKDKLIELTNLISQLNKKVSVLDEKITLKENDKL